MDWGRLILIALYLVYWVVQAHKLRRLKPAYPNPSNEERLAFEQKAAQFIDRFIPHLILFLLLLRS